MVTSVVTGTGTGSDFLQEDRRNVAPIIEQRRIAGMNGHPVTTG